MLTVVVRAGALEDTPALSFDAPLIVIGRGKSCEVRLPDTTVSHRHASITQRGSDYLLQDEGSTNGTFAGSVRLAPGAPRILRSGDLVRTGRVWLEIRVDHAAVPADRAEATRDIALNLAKSSMEAQGEATALTLRIVEGPDQGVELKLDSLKQVYVVGRSNAADLALTDEDASRRHLELKRSPLGLLVRDLGSKNGVLLDDQRIAIDQQVLWKKGQRLQLGQTCLSYEDPLSDALEELETATDERLSPTEFIEAPAQSPRQPIASTSVIAAARARPTHMPSATGPHWTASDVIVLVMALLMLCASGIGLWWLVDS